MRKSLRILHILASLFIIFFVGSALAAGYSCPSYKKYTSCAAGYYLSGGAVAGNSCKTCSTGYTSTTGNSGGESSCTKSCSVACTESGCPTDGVKTCTYNTSNPAASTGTEPQGGSCSASSPGNCNYTVKECNSGYGYSSTGTGSCTACTGRDVSAGTIAACSSCTAGTQPNTDRSACENCLSTSGSAACGCGSGTHPDGNGNCASDSVSCSAGTYLTANATSCTSCEANYYCPGGTFTPDSSIHGRTACSSLGSNYTTSATSSDAASDCYIPESILTAGKYIATKNSNQLTSCSAGTYRAAGTYYYGQDAQSCTPCAAGTYNDTTGQASCSACGAGHYCTGGSNRTACGAGTYSTATNASTSSTCTQCAAGTYNSSTGQSSCAACTGRTKYSSVGASACSTVSGGYYTTGCTSDNNCTDQTQCTGTTYCANGVQNNCPTNYTANTTAGKTAATQCQITCAAGTRVADKGEQCSTPTGNWYTAQHYVYWDSFSQYQTCISGYYTPSTTIQNDHDSSDDCKISCAAGTYWNGSKKQCEPCMAGNYCLGVEEYTSTTANSGLTSCANFGAGYTSAGGNKDIDSQSCYLPVAAGYVRAGASGTSLTACGTGQFKAAHNEYYGTSYSCDACTKKPSNATYTGTGGGTDTCNWTLTCAKGNYFKYSNTEQDRSCTTCTAGNYCLGVTATRSTGANTGLTACPTNYDDGGTALEKQSDCQIQTIGGKYIKTANASTQTDCEAGYACPAALVNYGGTGARNDCEMGTYSTGSAAVCNSCSALAGGMYPNSPKNSTSAAACYTNNLSGQYIAAAQNSSATNCAAGTSKGNHTVNYGNTSSCTPCASGKYSETGAAICTDCTAGYYCPGNSNRIACTTLGGNYTSSATSSDAASDCYIPESILTAGKYIATKNSNTPTSCPAGTYKTAHKYYYDSAAETCAVCAADTYSYAGAAACTGCLANYTTSGTAAADHDDVTDCKISCQAGYYLKTANDTSCTFADSGFWVAARTGISQTTTTAPNACPTGYSYSDRGRDEQADCYIFCPAGTHVAQANASACSTLTTDDMYIIDNYVYYGETSAPALCDTNKGYRIRNKTMASEHDEVQDCKINCGGGTYVATAYESCGTCPAGKYCPAATIDYGSLGNLQNCPDTYDYGAAGLYAPAQCVTQCMPGYYVPNATAKCQVLTTDDKYIGAHSLTYGAFSSPETCPTVTKNNEDERIYRITGKSAAGDHDSIEDCYQTCKETVHIAPPVGAIKTARYYTENYPKFCVYIPSCPVGYFENLGGETYDDSGYTSMPFCDRNPLDITFYPNGGIIGGGGASYTKNCYVDMTCRFDDLELNSFMRVGYVFGGWSRTAVGAPIYQNGDDIDGLEKTDFNLYAVWNTCAAGYTWDGAACAKCPIGTWSAGGTIASGAPKSCVACGAGVTTDNTGAISAGECKPCPAGSFCGANGGPAVSCSSLGSNYTSAGGAASSTDCYIPSTVLTDGKYIAKKNDNDPAACLAGKYKAAHNYYYGSDAEACLACKAGTYSAAGAGSCATCTAGYYCPGDSDRIVCTSVGDGSWSLAGAGAATERDCYKQCPDVALSYGVDHAKNAAEFYPDECDYSCTSDTGNPGKNIGGACVEHSCKNTYEMIGGLCRPCNRTNALSYSAGGNCEVESCVAGYHPNGKKCEGSVAECSAPNAAEAFQTWDAAKKAFGICTIKTCDAGYHVASNACVVDEQECVIENGAGYKEWDFVKNKWGECVVESCNPGYTFEPSETNELSKPCGQCKNKFSILGDLAASSYVRGCEIAACMHQGELYNLEGNECVPICDVNGYEDETGTMKWNPATRKCVRQCKEGFTPW